MCSHCCNICMNAGFVLKIKKVDCSLICTILKYKLTGNLKGLEFPVKKSSQTRTRTMEVEKFHLFRKPAHGRRCLIAAACGSFQWQPKHRPGLVAFAVRCSQIQISLHWLVLSSSACASLTMLGKPDYTPNHINTLKTYQT